MRDSEENERNPTTGQYRAKVDWSTVDWNKSNVELATLLGVSYQAVYRRRKKYEYPKAIEPSPGRRISEFVRTTDISSFDYQQIAAMFWRDKTEGVFAMPHNWKDYRSFMNAVPQYFIIRIRRTCLYHGKSVTNGQIARWRAYQYPWHYLDEDMWKLPNKLLAEVIGCDKRVVADYRRMNRKGKAVIKSQRFTNYPYTENDVDRILRYLETGPHTVVQCAQYTGLHLLAVYAIVRSLEEQGILAVTYSPDLAKTYQVRPSKLQEPKGETYATQSDPAPTNE